MQISQNTTLNGPNADAVEASLQLPSTQAGLRGKLVATPAAAASDTATLSLAASLLSQALAPDASQPAKVQQISAAVVSGRYTVDSYQLSSTIMQSMLDAHAD